ncbi:MAG: dihydrolipoyllysine-residue succinyltransferase [Parachlamydia sp.]|nr:dihydrolipoyllysine-residue succinyltransferase [Parachlamydia sp.]
MKIELKVPAMGESISEATIGQIFAEEGSFVKTDAEIFELETDKVNQVLYAPKAGRLSLLTRPGERVKIGQVLGVIDIAQEVEKEEIKEEPIIDKPEEKPVSQPIEKPLRLTKEALIPTFQKSSEESRELPARHERETRTPMSKIRKVIATRLVEAQASMAMLTTFNEADLSPIIELKGRHKDTFLKKYGTKLGFMSFFVKSVVSALKAYPQVNAYIDGDEIVQRPYFDISIAVGTDRGTLVPVVRDCDKLSFAEIELGIDAFAKKAKERTIVPDDLKGGGFTITNGGVYGSLLSTPILNPPQCAILGMHKIEKRAVVIDDQIVIRPMMYLALSYDHRLIDGKDSVSFLVHIKKCLEDPSSLLLDV